MRHATWMLAMLAGCAATTRLEPNQLYVHGVSYPDAASARVGHAFHAAPAARCEYGDGRPSEWATTGAAVAAGSLPPGIKLDEGALTGTPTQAGTYEATIEFHGVACGGKPFPDQRATVHLIVR
jgi:Putative Ig domain